MKQLSYGEIVEQIKKEKDIKIKIETLLEFGEDNFRKLIQIAFDKDIKFDLPDGIPKYKKSNARIGFGDLVLREEIKKIDNFILGRNHLPQIRRELLFIQILEGLDAQEAKLLCDVKEKKLSLGKGINKKLLERVYPLLFSVIK